MRQADLLRSNSPSRGGKSALENASIAPGACRTTTLPLARRASVTGFLKSDDSEQMARASLSLDWQMECANDANAHYSDSIVKVKDDIAIDETSLERCVAGKWCPTGITHSAPFLAAAARPHVMTNVVGPCTWHTCGLEPSALAAAATPGEPWSRLRK